MKRVFAVSDIHGHSDRFKQALIQAELVDEDLNWLDSNNLLVCCGDYIDRGPDSRGVIDILIQLSKSECVSFLMGNHEAMLIDGLCGTPYWLLVWLKNGGRNTLHSYGMNGGRAAQMLDGIYKKDILDIADYVGRDHLDFMARLKSHEIIQVGNERVIFVHAGLDPKKTLTELPLADEKFGTPSYLWIREVFFNHGSAAFLKKNYGVDRVVFGHTPTSYMTNNWKTTMRPYPKFGGKLLGIDTGSYAKNGVVSIVEILPGFQYKLVATA